MKNVTIYTDGACSGNPGPGGWGAILMYGDRKKELSGGERLTTNNRMELTAVITALEALKEPCRVELYSDSRYVIDALEKGWAKGWKKRGWVKSDKKPALNPDLWEELLALTGKHAVGRVIARPFTGTHPFTRTPRRHDFSLKPTQRTVLDEICDMGLTCYGVGKINDIFAGVGLNGFVRTEGNSDGMRKTAEFAAQDWEGLCFVNLVDFDMLYGHRNDVMGYTNALNEFDAWLGDFLNNIWRGDAVLITGDHGCDPTTPSTDHSREYVPLLKYGNRQFPEFSGTMNGFDNIGKMILEYLR